MIIFQIDIDGIAFYPAKCKAPVSACVDCVAALLAYGQCVKATESVIIFCLFAARKPFAPQNRLRQKTKFASRFNVDWVVQMRLEKYFSLRKSEVVSLIPPSRLDRRGVRVVTDVEAGCDGRDGITGRVVPRPAEPSGEAGIRGRPSRVVLIPRRWDQPLGLKSPGGTVAKKPGTPRRARSKPLKPLRREGRLSWLPCRCLRA